MSNNSSYGFTTDANELVKEMGVVMNEGIVKILNKFMNRYEMLERTHQEIMRLPSVLNELNMFEPKRETKNEEQTDIKQLCERVKMLENNIDKKINNILEIVQSLNQMLVLTPKTLEKPLEPLETIEPIDKPLTRVMPELHEDNDDFIINNKIIPSNTYQIKKRLQKKNTKNNILNEKFGLN